MTVVVDHLTKRLKDRTVIDDVSLVVPSKCVVGIKGVNGSGKTMLMRAIAGLIHPTQGSIFIDGEKLGTDLEFPPSIGLLIENPVFLDGFSGKENLAFLASIKSIINEQDVEHMMMCVGLDANDKRSVKKYSLGMRQRLGIAAAVMEHPKVMLLDEPANALDPIGIAMLAELIEKEKQRGAAILLSSHDSEFLSAVADTTFSMASGRLCELS